MFDTHVCLVSAQATPNLTPALDSHLKPRHMVLVASPDMQHQAQSLAAVIKRRGITVEQLDIADAYDYAAIEDALLVWLAANEEKGVALNVTGGTKLMAMAAQAVFASGNKPVFYVNAETNGVLFLDRRAPHPLDARVKLRDYLEAHGYALTGSPARPNILAAQRDLANRLVDHVESAGGALGQLNGLAQQARGSLQSPPLNDRQLDSIKLRDVIDLFADAEILHLNKAKQIVFSDEPARVFANGGWLEFHVHQALSDLAPTEQITDHALNLTVVAPNGRTKNELDAAFLHTNRLHIVETKASNLADIGATGDNKATDALYKLEALLKLGGLRTRAMLVDYRGKLTPADKARAAASNIRIVSGAQLKNIKGELKSWIHDAR